MIKKQLLELLYPKRCPFCREILKREDQEICPDCLKFVRYYYRIREPFCMKCGKALDREESLYCQDCETHKRSFERGFSVFRYGRRNAKPVIGKKPGYELHSMGESIRYFKFHNCRSFAGFYIDELMKLHGETLKSLGIDRIVPVPVHESRKRMRGFNQAELLADLLGEQLGIAVDSSTLVRIRKTRPQKELNLQERMKNLNEAFVIKEKFPASVQNVLLIDDIYTTGSTMEICSRRLKEAGAKKVYCVSICSGRI